MSIYYYHLARAGVLRQGSMEVEYIGPFGRMMVPVDVVSRSRRLAKLDPAMDRHEYMAAWCAFKLEREYKASIADAC